MRCLLLIYIITYFSWNFLICLLCQFQILALQTSVFSFELFLTHEWVGKWSYLGNLSVAVWQDKGFANACSWNSTIMFDTCLNNKHKMKEITHLEQHFSKQPTGSKAHHCQTRSLTTKQKFCKSQCKAGWWRPRLVLLIQATYYNWTSRQVLCFPKEKLNQLYADYSKKSGVETALWEKKSQILLQCLYWDREEGSEHS